MDELFKLIPESFAAIIRARLSCERLCEVRIINGAPVRVCYDGVYYFLCNSGITKDKSIAVKAGRNEAEQVVMRACSHSLFTVTDTLKRGYIAVGGGIRVGVCGAAVMNGGDVIAVKNFSSVNIRLPHEVKGCAAALAPKIAPNNIYNTLLVSPPGAGKTTMLRDLCRILSERNYRVVLCDEKYEIASVCGGSPTLDVGCCTDVISGMDKPNAIELAVACMSPDVIITDELFGGDMPCIRRAVTCGVAVISTVHARNIDDLRAKQDFKEIMAAGLFHSYAVLSGAPSRTVTVYEGVRV